MSARTVCAGPIEMPLIESLRRDSSGLSRLSPISGCRHQEELRCAGTVSIRERVGGAVSEANGPVSLISSCHAPNCTAITTRVSKASDQKTTLAPVNDSFTIHVSRDAVGAMPEVSGIVHALEFDHHAKGEMPAERHWHPAL